LESLEKRLAADCQQGFDLYLISLLHLASMLGLLPNQFFPFPRMARLFVASLVFMGVCAHAQKLQDMPLRFIVEQTEIFIAEGKFAEVAPFLDELENRFSDTKDDKIKAILQKFGFIRGVAFLQAFAKSNDKADLNKAANAFGDFAEKFPEDPKAIVALEKRTVCLRALHLFLEAAVDIEKILDEKGPYFKQVKKHSQILDLRFGLAQCYHVKQEWAKGEPAFNKLRSEAERVKHEVYLSYAVSCLTEMYITQADKDRTKIEKVFPLLPYLSGDTPARYDLRLNVNLFKGSKMLKDDKRHVEASLLLALTMTTEEIEVYYTERSKRLAAQQMQAEAFLKANLNALPKRRREVYQERLNDMAVKLNVAKGHLASVKAMDSYTTTLRWRKAENFQDVKRNWEAFWASYWLYKDYPKHELAENFIYAAFVSANKVKHRSKLIELGMEYIDNKSWQKFRSDITYILANAYREEAIKFEKLANDPKQHRTHRAQYKTQTEQSYGKFLSLCDTFMTDLPNHEYTKNIVNMMGSTFLNRKKTDELLWRFAGIRDGKKDLDAGYLNVEHFRDSPALGACSFYVGLSQLVTGEFEEAKPYFEAIVGVSVRGLSLEQVAADSEPADPEPADPEPEAPNPDPEIK
tara:strand:+ start:5832 stop:7733 length:1902 start_codon:yes stop_codon:yes gene_type:complete